MSWWSCDVRLLLGENNNNYLLLLIMKLIAFVFGVHAFDLLTYKTLRIYLHEGQFALLFFFVLLLLFVCVCVFGGMGGQFALSMHICASDIE